MARKVTSFVDKLKKMQETKANVCSQCNSEIQKVMMVKSVKSETKNNWRFNQNMVDVCKCNEKEVFQS